MYHTTHYVVCQSIESRSSSLPHYSTLIAGGWNAVAHCAWAYRVRIFRPSVQVRALDLGVQLGKVRAGQTMSKHQNPLRPKKRALQPAVPTDPPLALRARLGSDDDGSDLTRPWRSGPGSVQMMMVQI